MTTSEKRKLLIISSEDDVHANSVSKALGSEYCVVWNPDWERELSLVCTLGNGLESPIAGEVGGFKAAELSAVWYRRPISAMPRRRLRTLDYFVARERDDALEAVLDAWHTGGTPVYNRPRQNYFSSIKPVQYRVAVQVGLKLPKTLISNDPEAVRHFLEDTPRAVLKGVSLSGFDNGEEHYALFVQELDSSALRDIDGRLPRCPAVVQEIVDWTQAARVVVLQDKIWCFLSDRRQHLDWRVDTDAPWSFGNVPADIADKLRLLHNELGLLYACADMLIDQSGNWWFLETNANGQWLWLEESSSYPLSRELGAAMVGSGNLVGSGE